MILKWTLIVVNVLLFIGSVGWLIVSFIRIIDNTVEIQEGKYPLLFSLILLVLSVVFFIVRKIYFPVPGIDYK